MILFGITGGIGMGKSTAGDLLLKDGLTLIDTDIIARDVVRPGEPALKHIQQEFGSHLLSDAGELRRDVLAKLVFEDPSARARLEAILHPRIRKVWQEEVQRWRAAGTVVGFVVIPLLFETETASEFDAVISVACSSETQRQRLRKRQWDDAHIARRISAQWPIEKKVAASDYVIWTDTTLQAHHGQLKRVLEMAR